MENIDKTKENKIVESGRLKDYSTTITILEHISDAIFILNPSGKIEYANNIALEMLGLNLEKIVGQNLNNYIVTDLNIKKLNSEDPSDFLLKTIYEGVYNEVETALVNGNHITPVIISFGLVQNGKGQINHIIASAKDISIRKELERELRQQELLNISRDRFKELGELVINMVHNFSQPITSIQLLAEYMQKLIGKEEIDKNALEKNLNNMIKLLNIINASISNLRNIAYAAEDDSLKSIDIIHSIEKLEKQISYDLIEKDIIFEKKYDYAIPQVLASPIQVQQVLVILIKYIITAYENLEGINFKWPENYKRKICLLIKNIEEKWVDIQISDNFEDIYSECETNICSLYSKAGFNAVNTSLDLAMVKIVVSSLGGDLRIVEKTSGGIIFSIRLPIDQKEEREELLNLIELMHKERND